MNLYNTYDYKKKNKIWKQNEKEKEKGKNGKNLKKKEIIKTSIPKRKNITIGVVKIVRISRIVLDLKELQWQEEFVNLKLRRFEHTITIVVHKIKGRIFLNWCVSWQQEYNGYINLETRSKHKRRVWKEFPSKKITEILKEMTVSRPLFKTLKNEEGSMKIKWE